MTNYKNKLWLYKMYVVNDLNSNQIAKLSDCDGMTILRHLHKNNIKIRKPGYGKKSNRWNGGKYKEPNGYIKIHSPNHKKRDSRNYVREHILIMENHIYRNLKKGEAIHHINGNKSDNRICNLMLFKNSSEHMKFEHKIGTRFNHNGNRN